MTQEYLGQKIVTAWHQEKDGQEGYAVKYPGGYTSWCPKAAFEEANIALGQISGLPPHQQRVIAEHAALSDKMIKLKGFIGTDIFSNLDRDDQTLLIQQLAAMSNYISILEVRMGRF